MKKLITFILAITMSLVLMAQEFYTPVILELTAGGGTYSVPLDQNSQITYIYGNAVMTSNWTIQADVGDIPVIGTMITVQYEGTMDFNGNTFTVFGQNIPDSYESKSFILKAYYNGVSWDKVFFLNFGETAIINTSHIVARAIGSDEIALAGVDTINLFNIARGYILTGNTSNRPIFLDASTTGYMLVGDGNDLVSVAMSGDATMIASGAVTIADNAVTNAKLYDIAQGYVKVGGAADAPTDLNAKTDGYMLIGDGTDINSVDVTGVIEITNTGVTTINTGTVDVVSLDSNMIKDIITVPVAFAAGEIGTYQIRVPFKCKVMHVYGQVTLAIAATDSATVQLQNHAGVDMTGGYLKFPAASVFGVGQSSQVYANNAIGADEYLKIVVDKATAGGKVLLSIEVLRQD